MNSWLEKFNLSSEKNVTVMIPRKHKQESKFDFSHYQMTFRNHSKCTV